MFRWGFVQVNFTNILEGYFTDTGPNARETGLKVIGKYIAGIHKCWKQN